MRFEVTTTWLVEVEGGDAWDGTIEAVRLTQLDDRPGVTFQRQEVAVVDRASVSPEPDDPTDQETSER
jgi:hypothetical protein